MQGEFVRQVEGAAGDRRVRRGRRGVAPFRMISTLAGSAPRPSTTRSPHVHRAMMRSTACAFSWYTPGFVKILGWTWPSFATTRYERFDTFVSMIGAQTSSFPVRRAVRRAARRGTAAEDLDGVERRHVFDIPRRQAGDVVPEPFQGVCLVERLLRCRCPCRRGRIESACAIPIFITGLRSRPRIVESDGPALWSAFYSTARV